MKYLSRNSFLFLIVFVSSLFVVVPARAIPLLPSSFYGTVKVNGNNVADGTLIQAFIGGQVFAEGYSQSYQGNSVYSLDVRGDDSATAALDGGREGDAVQFKIGGVLADQAAVWHSGTNVNLNLTASSPKSISTPQKTRTPVPTQTAIVIIQPSPVPTAIIQPSPVPTAITQALTPPTVLIQSSPTATNLTQSSPLSTTHLQPSPIPTPTENENGSGNIAQVVIIIIMSVLAIIIGYVFLALRRKKM